HDLSFDFSTHHDLCNLYPAGLTLLFLRPSPPGRSIRVYFTKLLTIFKQQTANDFVFVADNPQQPEVIRKKPAVRPAFSITSPGGECRSGCC
ncbi:hypothetical protein CWN65_05470, partial [Klebsiella pneumoniae]|uniref:hypothetical protein n=1 Tax=Klebsiella pneumoniae TaxID=573 RepID=UPI000C7CC019